MLDDGFYELSTAKRSGCGEQKAFIHNRFNHWAMENCSVHSTVTKWGMGAGGSYEGKKKSIPKYLECFLLCHSGNRRSFIFLPFCFPFLAILHPTYCISL